MSTNLNPILYFLDLLVIPLFVQLISLLVEHDYFLSSKNTSIATSFDSISDNNPACIAAKHNDESNV